MDVKWFAVDLDGHLWLKHDPERPPASALVGFCNPDAAASWAGLIQKLRYLHHAVKDEDVKKFVRQHYKDIAERLDGNQPTA